MPFEENNLDSLIAKRDALLARKIGIKPGVEEEFGQVNPLLHEAVMSSPSPITITSGFRNPKQNIAAGGVPGSYHTKGGAVDIRGQIDQPTREHFESLGFQVIQEPKKGHTHIEPLKAPMDNNQKAMSRDDLIKRRDELIAKKAQSTRIGMDANTYGYKEEQPSSQPPTLDQLREQKRRELGTFATSLGNVGLFGQGPKVIGGAQQVLESLGLQQPESVLLKDQPFAQREQKIKQTMGEAFQESPQATVAGGLAGAYANPLSRLIPGGSNLLTKILSGAAQGAAEFPAYEVGTNPTEEFSSEDLIKKAGLGAGLGGALPLIAAPIKGIGKFALTKMFGKAVPEAAPLTQAEIWEPLKKILTESAGRGEAAAIPQEIAEAIGTRGLPAQNLERIIQPSKILSPEGVPAIAGGMAPAEKTLQQLVDLKQAMGAMGDPGKQVAGKLKTYLGTLGEKFGQQNIDKLMEIIAQSEKAYQGQGIPQAAAGVPSLGRDAIQQALSLLGLPPIISRSLPYLLKGGAKKTLPEGLATAGKLLSGKASRALPAMLDPRIYQ